MADLESALERDSGARQEFIVTSFMEDILHRESSLLKQLERGDRFMVGNTLFVAPHTDQYRLDFTYAYILEASPSGLWPVELDPRRDEYQLRGTSDQSLTVVCNRDGEKCTEHLPGEKISYTGPQLLDFALQLDSTASSSTKATLPGWARVSGAELVVSIECFNDIYELRYESLTGRTMRGLPDLQATPSIDVPICILKVDLVSMSSRTQDWQFFGDSVCHREYRGISVRAEVASSNFRYLDQNGMLLQLTTLLVMLRFAKFMLRHFVTTCLGHLSKIYRRAIFEPFDMVEECCGASTRLMAKSVEFVQLADAEEDGAICISRDRMLERLTQGFERRSAILNSMEIRILTMFCLREALRPKRSSMRENLKTEVKNLIATKLSEAHYGSHINIDVFSRNCSSLEKLSFTHIVKLFDKDRKMSCLERVFTPSRIWRSIHKAHPNVIGSSIRGSSVPDLPLSSNAQDTSSDFAESATDDAQMRNFYRLAGASAWDQIANIDNFVTTVASFKDNPNHVPLTLEDMKRFTQRAFKGIESTAAVVGQLSGRELERMGEVNTMEADIEDRVERLDIKIEEERVRCKARSQQLRMQCETMEEQSEKLRRECAQLRDIADECETAADGRLACAEQRLGRVFFEWQRARKRSGASCTVTTTQLREALTQVASLVSQQEPPASAAAAGAATAASTSISSPASSRVQRRVQGPRAVRLHKLCVVLLDKVDRTEALTIRVEEANARLLATKHALQESHAAFLAKRAKGMPTTDARYPVSRNPP